jgi:hypothetical protein
MHLARQTDSLSECQSAGVKQQISRHMRQAPTNVAAE